MLIIYLLTVLIVLIYALYCHFTRNFNYWKKRNIVSPEPTAVFGNIKEAILKRENMAVTITELYNKCPNEKIVGIFRMNTPCLLVRDLNLIQHIMIKDFDLFKDRGIEFSKEGLGKNLFHADGDTWTILRSRFNPMFTPGKLKNMFHLLNERGDVFVNNLDKDCRINSEYHINSLLQKYTLSTIFACAFGVDYDSSNKNLNETLMALDKLILSPSFVQTLDLMYPGILKKLNMSLFPAFVTNFFQKLVADITAQRNGQPSPRGDFMDLMLSMRDMKEVNNLKKKDDINTVEITDDLMSAQAFVFYVAGYETSASTMSYLLYELGQNPEIQDKLREEIDSVLKAHNGEMSYEALNEMKYLEKAFSETLRKHPIVDPLQRRAEADYEIPGTDIVIEKDMMLLIPVRGIHHDEKYYPDPQKFDPERFSPEAIRARHPCAYLPFGIGRRNCIGFRFGGLQSRLCIAKLISKFRVETCKNTKLRDIDPDRVVVVPIGGFHLNIVPRDS